MDIVVVLASVCFCVVVLERTGSVVDLCLPFQPVVWVGSWCWQRVKFLPVVHAAQPAVERPPRLGHHAHEQVSKRGVPANECICS